MKSTHTAEVFQIDRIESHPNADRLELVFFEGFQTIVQKGLYKLGDLAVFIPPDNLVPTDRSEFAFLAKEARGDGKYRIKAKKLRGTVSFGLVIPAPPNVQPGDDVSETLRVEHYDPYIPEAGGETVGGPSGLYYTKYDVDALRSYVKKYRDLFTEGEPVIVQEKMNGENMRCVFMDGQMYVGSRNEWKKEDYESRWWRVLEATPNLRDFCQNNPGYTVYGESFGHVGGMRYGRNGAASFAGFDIRKPDGSWMDMEEVIVRCNDYGIPLAPLFNNVVKLGCECCIDHIEPIPYNFGKICELAEGRSLYTGADHLREGVVVTPFKERVHPRFGRVKVKVVSSEYLEKYS